MGENNHFHSYYIPLKWELGDDLIGAENVNQSFKSEIMNLNSEGF